MRSLDSTCWSLILGAGAGDVGDQDSFVRRYRPAVCAYLSARWRVPADHEDVNDGAQETFLECFKGGGALGRVDQSRPGGFRAFLYGICRNVARMIESKRQVRERHKTQDDLHEIETSETTLTKEFDRAWAQIVMGEARERMAARAARSATQRLRLQALEFRYQYDLPSREIAVKLGVDCFRVYKLLNEARKEFRAALLEVMAEYHPNDVKDDVERRCVELLAVLGE